MYVIAVLLHFSVGALSQVHSISGKIVDQSNNPLPYANMQVMSEDSVFVIGGTSSDDGSFFFEDIPTGVYILSIYFMGYEPYNQEFNLSGELQFYEITLYESSIELDGVIVTARKPTIKRTIDRYTLSLSNTYIGGKTTLDILKFAPGVIVDKNEQLLINRKKATVIVNNRQLRMNGEQLNDYLLSLNSEDIENIEIFPSPTSEMDAEGTGGIIKINLKKGVNRGTNFYANSGYNKGITPAFDGGSGFNYNTNNFTFYGSYFFNYTEPYLKYDEKNTHEQNEISLLDKVKRHDRNRSHSYRLGVEYALNDSHMFILEADFNNSDRDNKVSNGITEIMKNNVLDSIVNGRFPNDRSIDTYGLSFNYVWDVDKNESTFKFISDYFNSNTHSNESYNSSYFLAKVNSLLFNSYRKANNKNDISIFSLKTDFEKIFANQSKFSTGLKYSLVESSNDNKFFKSSDETNWTVDETRTNLFKYKEHILASYLNYSNSIGKLEFSLGLRGEYTKYESHSVTSRAASGDGDYFKVFPTLFLMYPLSERDQLIINYNRRISRPEYRIMNPFEYFINEYNIKRGNENIKPSYSNNIELTYALGSNYFTLNYTNEKNMVGEYYIRRDDNITIHTYNNMANYNGLFFTVFSPISLFKWWSMDNYLNVGYHKYTEPNFKNDSYIFQFSSSNYFSLPHDLKGELEMGFSPKGSAFLYDKYETTTFVVNISLQKSFINDQLHVKLFANDIINSQGNFETSNAYNGQYIYSKIKKDNRRFGLSVRYNLDFGKKISKRGRERSNEDELMRN